MSGTVHVPQATQCTLTGGLLLIKTTLATFPLTTLITHFSFALLRIRRQSMHSAAFPMKKQKQKQAHFIPLWPAAAHRVIKRVMTKFDTTFEFCND